MQPGRQILLDFLLNFIVNSNPLAVNNFLDPLAVFVLAGNLGSNLNGLKVIFLLHGHCNQAFCNLADFFCPGLSCPDMSMI